MEWFEIKQQISDVAGLSKDALHIHLAVAIQFAAAIILRRSLGSALPWSIVWLAVLWNEWSDLRVEHWPDRSEQYWNGVHDLWNTMLMPSLLLLAVRYKPQLFVIGGGTEPGSG